MLPRSLPAFGSVMQMAPIFSPRSADRKSTRLNSSHSQISYAVFCLKKKKLSPDDQRQEECQLYQTLLALNLLEHDAPQRFESMALSPVPLQEAVASLHAFFSRVSYP